MVYWLSISLKYPLRVPYFLQVQPKSPPSGRGNELSSLGRAGDHGSLCTKGTIEVRGDH
jgi:hypothetical protein